MDKNDKTKDEKPATTEAQNKDETQKFSASDNFSDSVVARESLKKKIEECENKYKRALADYQNLEKRTREERLSWIKTANKDLIIKLLPVLDDLYLANKHLQDEGLRLIIQKFFGILNKEGLTELPPTVGMLFIPESMRSIGSIEAEDEKDGRVVEQIRAGYKLNGEVIRPTEVIVGQRKSKV